MNTMTDNVAKEFNDERVGYHIFFIKDANNPNEQDRVGLCSLENIGGMINSYIECNQLKFENNTVFYVHPVQYKY